MFGNCCKCCSSKEVLEMETSAHPSWVPGQFNANFENDENKVQDDAVRANATVTRTTELITQEPMAINEQEKPTFYESSESLTSIDVRLGIFETERFKDMAPTIFKHYAFENPDGVS